MRYVAQQHPLGCFIAATAMVLDMTYEEVAACVPLQDNGIPSDPPIEEVINLAETRGVAADDPEMPLTCQHGRRYILALRTGTKQFHAIAVDETGAAFDPSNQGSRRLWAEYEPAAMLEFRSRLGDRSHCSGVIPK